MNNIRLAVPKTVKKNEIIEIKALIQHPMESGFRRGSRGEVIPRNIITAFECRYNDEVVFAAELFPAMSANPFLTFYTRAVESGKLTLKWTHENGEEWTDSAEIAVT